MLYKDKIVRREVYSGRDGSQGGQTNFPTAWTSSIVSANIFCYINITSPLEISCNDG